MWHGDNSGGGEHGGGIVWRHLVWKETNNGLSMFLYLNGKKHKQMPGFNVTQYYFRNNSEVHAHWPMKDIWSGEIRKAGPRVHGGMLRNVVDATFGLCFVRNAEWKSWIMFCTE